MVYALRVLLVLGMVLLQACALRYTCNTPVVHL